MSRVSAVLETLEAARNRMSEARKAALKSAAKAKADAQAAVNEARSYERARAAVAAEFPEVTI